MKMTLIFRFQSSRGAATVINADIGLLKDEVNTSIAICAGYFLIMVCHADDTPFRLYRESNPALKTVSWISIAGTTDEIRAVATELEEEDGSKHALALKEKIIAAIPRFEDGETVRSPILSI